VATILQSRARMGADIQCVAGKGKVSGVRCQDLSSATCRSEP
jgi:hypothetical protein